MSRNRRRNRRNTSGGNSAAHRNRGHDTVEGPSAAGVLPRSSTETKSALRTTELIAYAGAVLAVIMTALAVDGDAEGHNDPFGAEAAIRYITYLTVGYLVARGLAKSGSHENRVDRDTDLADDGARTVVIHGEDTRNDGDVEQGAAERDSAEQDAAERDTPERDIPERDGDAESVDAVAASSDEARDPGAGTTDPER